MPSRITVWITAALIVIAGCQSITADTDVPAIVVNPDDASRAALQTTLASRFGGQAVMLADDALTRSSLLTIEISSQDSPKAITAQGRNMGQPLRFRLVKNGSECTLIDLRDDSRHVLADTSCVPEQ